MAPMMNLNPALGNILMLDQVDIFRRAVDTNQYGEGRSEWDLNPKVPAVVFPGGENKLDRRPEAQSTTKVIELVCRFAVRIASPGFQADVLRWRGDYFTVVSVLDYSLYGAGFVQAMGEARSPLQHAPETR